VLSDYRDRAQIPSQCVAAVAAATQNRLVVLSPQIDRLNPLAPITQAEAAALIYQAGVMQGRRQAIASPQIVSPQIVSPAATAFGDPQKPAARLDTNALNASIAVVLQVNLPLSEVQSNLQSNLQSSLQSSLQPNLAAAETVLAIAQETISLLQFQGIEAFLGRSDDATAALSVSLQMALPDPAAADSALENLEELNGIAVSHPADSLESARFAQLVHKTILRHIDTRSHGVQPEENSAPIASSSIAIPMICITVGFVTGKEDAINLRDADYRRCMARAIAEGILHYVQFTATFL